MKSYLCLKGDVVETISCGLWHVVQSCQQLVYRGGVSIPTPPHPLFWRVHPFCNRCLQLCSTHFWGSANAGWCEVWCILKMGRLDNFYSDLGLWCHNPLQISTTQWLTHWEAPHKLTWLCYLKGFQLAVTSDTQTCAFKLITKCLAVFFFILSFHFVKWLRKE